MPDLADARKVVEALELAARDPKNLSFIHATTAVHAARRLVAALERTADKCKYPEECKAYGRCIRPDDHDNPPPCNTSPPLPAGEVRVPGEPTDMEARKDAAYLERNRVVAALAKCFPSGRAKTAIEGWSEDWHGCVYIDLPTGQASWHYHDSHAHLFDFLPLYAGIWDGHTTDEKYDRLAMLAARPQTAPTDAMAADIRAQIEDGGSGRHD